MQYTHAVQTTFDQPANQIHGWNAGCAWQVLKEKCQQPIMDRD